MPLLVIALTSAFTLLVLRVTGGRSWRRTRDLQTRPRWRKRLFMIVVAFLGGSCSHVVLLAGEEWGHWRCAICGDTIYQARLFGWTVTSAPSKSDWLFPPGERGFSAWFAEHVSDAHDHDWRSVGCHPFGQSAVDLGLSGVADYAERFERGYFAALPHIPDQELAVRMATRVLRASHDERRTLLLAFFPPNASNVTCADGYGVPWGHYLCREDEALSAVQFESEYRAWLAVHPEWQDDE